MSGLFDYEKENRSDRDEYGTNARGLGILPEQNRGLGVYQKSDRGDELLTDADIQVCLDSREPERFNADAVTKGNRIFLSGGKSSMGTEALLRHEMGHVVQQRRGKIPVTGSVSGHEINDSAALENEADRLGDMIPVKTVQRTLFGAGRGLSLQNIPGVVQCSGKGKGKKQETRMVSRDEWEIKTCIEQWKECRDELDSLKKEGAGSKKKGMSSKKNRDEIIALQGKCNQKELQLMAKLASLYPGHKEFIDAMVHQIGQDKYGELGLPLMWHLYEARSMDDHEQKLTGLHAYSEGHASGGHAAAEGVTPSHIQPLGYIGRRDQVHILHWKLNVKGIDGTKFSTMLPNTMPEAVSKILFGIARNVASETEFGEIKMGSSGDTLYPMGDNIGISVDPPEGGEPRFVTRGEVLGKKTERADKPITLGEIYEIYSPFADDEEVLARLEELGIYHPL